MAAPISALAVVRKGVRAALNTNVTISAVDVPILTNAGQGQEYPYIIIGGAGEIPWNTADASTGIGSQVIINVEAWTRDSAGHSYDYTNSDDIASQVRQALDHQALTLASGTFCGCHLEETLLPEEQADGITLRHISRYTVLVRAVGDPI